MAKLRMLFALVTLGSLAGCPSPNSGPDLSKSVAAVTDAFSHCEGQDTSGTNPGPFTWTYNSPSSGSVALTLNGVEYTGPTEGTWGTLVFSGYNDAASGDTISGTLQIEVFQTAGTYSFQGAVQWGVGFTGLVDVTGTLQFSGNTTGNVSCDFLATVNGAAISLSGTVSLGSTFYDASTGKETNPPVPSVSFSPASSYAYAPSGGTPLTMTSAGSTIYYTVDGTTPTTGSTQYSGPITSGVSNLVVMAFGTNGAASSRISLIVYPSLGT